MGAEADGQTVAIDGFLGLANGHDDTAPVGVLARDGGLDQGAVGDRLGELAGRSGTGGAVHRDLDELGCPLTVADQLVGQIQHHPVERAGEGLQPPIPDPADARRARGAGGEQQAGVVGRGVPVDRHRVEGGAHMQAQHGPQHIGMDVRIGDDERQHGGHVGRDHARPLGDAGDADLEALDLGLGVRPFGEGVRGHDALPGPRPLLGGRGVGVEAGLDLGQTGGDLAVVEGDADHAGRGEHDVALATAEALGHFGGGATRGIGSRLAGKGVGATRIDDQRPHVLATVIGIQMAPAPVDRRRADLVPGEDACTAGAPGKTEDHQIVALMLVEAGARGRDLDPADMAEGRKRHGQRRNLQTRLAGRRGRLGRGRLSPAFQGGGDRVEGLFEGVAAGGAGLRSLHSPVPAETGAEAGSSAGDSASAPSRSSTSARPRSCSRS